MKHIPRLVSALVLLLGAILLHYIGKPFYLTITLWFLLAIGIGFLLPYRWIVLSAVIPWPRGVGLGLVTGRYLFLGEAWPGAAILSFGIGFVGSAIGVGGMRILQHRGPTAA